MNIAGQFITTSNSPFDGHFDPNNGGSVGPTQALGNYGSGTTTIYYGSVVTGQPYYPDPLMRISEPTSQSTACPGSGPNTYTASSYSGSVSPGVYTSKVTFTGPVTLQDCGNGVPGIYVFTHGAIFKGQVTGSNVLLYSQGAISPTSYCTDTTQSNHGAAQTNEVNIGSSSGLTAPTAGPYKNLLLFQSRSVPAHIGFKICPGDAGNIILTGTVYAHNKHDVPNDSRATMSVTNTCPSWCTAGAGSALVFGTDDNYQDGANPGPSCLSKGTCVWPNYGGGSMTIDGCAVVDVFYTTGNADVTIQYDTNHVPLFGSKLIN